ncbi:SDR family NAD(P)-dependent oxidoreductase [Kineococcus arenarius]|uniref:SDR family NAD(P)-dependent oxidoreductase n=1 Tax=unclassified Kineococcus TaxID=2621656 RepID=UPI003D7F0E4C
MDLELTGHTALITGGDSGIGWHTARLLLAEGARVALTDVDAGRLRAPRRSSPPR